ncbi:hypothetical protein [Methanosphaerula palustris]|uniref:Uncharacterized protein n=1 Tax=Methanosphaerula palustris (strain ATCC BAA-1556 / DSM 19958 / E1-9c) TaxID=521011 RepID=B8GEY5_METPE|nr:hypothetical protein [Methanosphaerula palustris]ACL17791.1 conserved hypothetical protein [Methanosphaerula palustris E1-9c]
MKEQKNPGAGKGKKPSQKATQPTTANWKKILVIGVGVLFVVLMVVSSMGMSWLNTFSTVQNGSVVTADLTIRDDLGRPIITSDKVVYAAAAKQNQTVLLTNQLTVPAGGVYDNTSMQSLPVTAPQSANFTVFGDEYQRLVDGLIGMHVNQMKTVPFDQNSSETQNVTISSAQFEQLGMNFTNATINEQVVLSRAEGLDDTTDVNATPTGYSLRTTKVVDKSADNLTLSFAYKGVDLTVASIAST